jgi:uncharacterized membrane protein
MTMTFVRNGQNGAAANPSSWSHRLPVIVLALVGCAVSTYLTLYQWHVTASVWDPIFGTGSSEAVLISFVSRYLPLPDATLGALAYLIEAMVTAAGGTDRSRTSPWLVMLFGLVLVGLALTSVALVLIQVFLVHALCTLCLCSAAVSFINVWLGRDEVFASLRELQQARARGVSVSTASRHGGVTGDRR